MNAVKAIGMDESAADHLATIDWQRGAWSDKKGKYSRQHTWVLVGAKLKASESGAVTPAAYRDNTPFDPHNMFAATISSAHMLTWLHMAFSLDVEVEPSRSAHVAAASMLLRYSSPEDASRILGHVPIKRNLTSAIRNASLHYLKMYR
jgi:hypothetical protein